MSTRPAQVSRLGEPQQEGDGPEVHTYASHLFDADAEPFFLATLRVALWKAEGNALAFQLARYSEAVPLAPLDNELDDDSRVGAMASADVPQSSVVITCQAANRTMRARWTTHVSPPALILALWS